MHEHDQYTDKYMSCKRSLSHNFAIKISTNVKHRQFTNGVW